MKTSKYLLPLLIFVLFITPLKGADSLRDSLRSEIIMDGDVIMGNVLPRYGVLCNQVDVYGAPTDEGVFIRTVAAGERVRLREQSHGADRSWVMIAPAEWIRLSALCR